MSESSPASPLVFDVSEHVKVELTDRDAARFLHNLCTNDIVSLPVDRGCEAFFCTAKAKVVAHAVVWHLPTDGGAASTFWLDAGPGPSEGFVKYLDRYLISEQVEIKDRTADFGQYRVVGAGANQVAAALGADVPDTRDLRHFVRSIAGVSCHVFCHDLLHLPAFDLLCARDAGPAIRQALVSAGATPGDAQTLEVLRVEAGLPEFGKDMDENRFVVEVGRTAQAICYTKGCYLGQEPIVMARDRGHVNRFFVGLKLSGEAVAAHGAKVFHGDREVGIVTSSVRSPRLGPIALGYLWRGSHEPGTTVQVEEEGGRRGAVVAALPFEAPTRE